MKIILFFSWKTSLQDWIRNGNVDRELKPYLRDNANKYYFFTYGNKTDSAYPTSPNIEIVPFIYSPLRALSLLIKADIYKSNQIWGSWVPVFFSKIFLKKLWIRAGYEHYKNHNTRKSNFFKKNFSYFISKIAYSNADIVTLTSNEISTFVATCFNINPKKIYTHYNYIDTEVFQITQPIKLRKNEILFVGRMNAHKNIIQLIHSMNYLNIPLTIVGSGEYKSQIAKAARSLNLSLNIIDNVPNTDLYKYYNNFRFFCLPSLFEGNSKVILEAMACGCIVIANDIAANAELITSGSNGFLVNASCDFSIELKKILELPLSELETISNNASKFIHEKCSLKSYLEFENNVIRLLK